MAINSLPARQRVWIGPLPRAGFIATLCLLLAGGCATLAQFVEVPRVSVAELAVVDAGLTRQRFRIALDVENTNPFPLPIARFDYALDLAGQRFAAGSSANAVTLGSLSTERIALEFDTDLMTSAVQLAQLFIGTRLSASTIG